MVSIVQIRYAEALYKIASGNNNLDKITEEVEIVKDIMMQQEDFLKVLSHPQVNQEVKINIIKNIFNGKISQEIIGLFVLTIQKGRQDLIIKILDEYINIVKGKKNIATAMISSAIELSNEYIERIKHKLQTVLNKDVEIKNNVDKEVIGGLKIQVDNTLFDRTIKTRIEELKKAL